MFVIATTSRPDSLEMAIRRSGRFDSEISLPVPDEKSRILILHTILRDIPYAPTISIDHLAKDTPGYVPADLTALIKKAGVFAVQRIANLVQQLKLKDDESTPISLDLHNSKTQHMTRRDNKEDMTRRDTKEDTIGRDTKEDMTEGDNVEEEELKDSVNYFE